MLVIASKITLNNSDDSIYDFNETDFVVLTHGQQYFILHFLFDRSRRGMCLSLMRAGNTRLTDLFHLPWPLMVTCVQSVLRTQLGD